MLGFLLGFGHFRASHRFADTQREDIGTLQSAPVAEKPVSRNPNTPPDDTPGTPPADIGLELTTHDLGEDENGLFISGTIYNRAELAYDAVKVIFDLCDDEGVAYSYVTDSISGNMHPGDSWSFSIYIPYMELVRFSSYRLQNIMGVRK